MSFVGISLQQLSVNIIYKKFLPKEAGIGGCKENEKASWYCR